MNFIVKLLKAIKLITVNQSAFVSTLKLFQTVTLINGEDLEQNGFVEQVNF